MDQHEPMSPMAVAEAVDYVADHSLVYARDGVIVAETYINTLYPSLNLDRLCGLWGDSLGDWSAVKKEMVAQAWRDYIPPKPPPAPVYVGTSWDLFSGDLRPVYNPPKPAGEDALQRTPYRP